MRKTNVTEKNIHMIVGMLKRFFQNQNRGFEMHHNFDSGYKNIQPYSRKTIQQCVDAIELATDIFTGKKFIRITFQKGVSATILHLGSFIIFKGGNEIVTQQKWIGGDFKYVYTVYRLKKLSISDKANIHDRREWEKELSESYWRDIENEYFDENEYECEEIVQ